MRFEFATAGRIVVGPGTSQEIPYLIDDRDKKVLLLHGKAAIVRDGHSAKRIRQLELELNVVDRIGVKGEPTIDSVEHGASRARESGCELLVAIGGGSVIDTAKAIAGLAVNPGPAISYMEVVGDGLPLSNPALPIAAVPTTAGTGSEATRNAVIAATEKKVKVSIRSPHLMPQWAIVDSLLTHDVPPEITASSGLDALTQLIEAFVSQRANPITNALCLEGLNLAARSLSRAYKHPDDATAREEMSTASLLSGIALANGGLGIIHGIAGVIGGAFGIAHGAAVAAVLPQGTKANIEALESHDSHHPALGRYETIGQILAAGTHHPGYSRRELWMRLQEVTTEMEIARLSNYGIRSGDVPALAAQAAKANSTRSNPVELTIPRIEEIIEKSL